jgi:hypothetical protein
MKGVGRIFEAYRDGILTDDDEVAVLHGPEELGYPAVTEAMVNIRATLEKGVTEGVLDSALAARVMEMGKNLFYKARNWDAVLRVTASRATPPITPIDLVAWLREEQIDQKRTDALGMIRAIRAHLATEIPPLIVPFRFHDTGYHKAAARLF